MAEERPLLELKSVGRAFGPRLLFRKVNLAFEPGRIYLLLGPNGAGKSTLMKIMAGLLPPDEGELAWNIGPDKIAYMAHATFIYPGLSALENLMFWAEALKLPQAEQKALAALKRVGLERHARDRAGIFSRGMAQRLNLARLLLGEPALLLLDEPGTGLDLRSRALLRELAEEARQRGACVVWISHDLKEDGALADCLLHLENKGLRPETASAAPEAMPC